MLLKILFIAALTCFALADKTLENNDETQGPQSLQFETSHKNPEPADEDSFNTAHKISPFFLSAFTSDNGDFGGLRFLRSAMNFAPTKERPELNPVLSALINEDVRKSIEAKRAIEKEELDAVKAEIDAAVAKTENRRKPLISDKLDVEVESATDSYKISLTTVVPPKKADLDDDLNIGFVDQTISLDSAGSDNKKSRIEIKKGPNGQEYEYEYVYYYEEEEEDSSKSKPADAAVAQSEDSNLRGKSRYSTIDRSTSASPTENSLGNGKAKGRSSNVNTVVEEIEPERLPAHTRFPSRGKNIEVQPTPSIELQQEKKKISVKRPSLELVDSETFNTDEKQAKGSPRNGDTEANKPAPVVEQEQPAKVDSELIDTTKKETEAESATTIPVSKSGFDLYAISINEKLNGDLTTISNDAATTTLPDTTDFEEGLTTLFEALPSSTPTTTTTTTTTTTEAPTTTTAKPGKTSLFGNRRPGLGNGGRNRFKSKTGGEGSTTSTEAPAASEQPKTGRNRFSRPPVGGRSRPASKTTAAPAPSVEEEEKIEVKEVKPVSTGFSRNKPRNRFNLRGSTTEKPEEPAHNNPEEVSSTTARSLRSRPTLNLRGRSRPTTTKAPTNEEETDKNVESESEPKQSAAPTGAGKHSRYNLNRPGANRLLPRNKFTRPTETPGTDDSAADSSHHNDVKNEDHQDSDSEKSENKDETPVAGHGVNRLKNRPRLNLQAKTENFKPKPSASPAAPRKINPLLSKRRLQLGASTTEAAPVEEAAVVQSSDESDTKEQTNFTADDNESAKEETTEESETTTKQARGLGLLGQRRRLPLRKPGTIL